MTPADVIPRENEGVNTWAKRMNLIGPNEIWDELPAPFIQKLVFTFKECEGRHGGFMKLISDENNKVNGVVLSRVERLKRMASEITRNIKMGGEAR